MREALELALYSFRYLEDVTMVAVLLPQSDRQVGERGRSGGGAATPSSTARATCSSELQVPLDRTLSPRTPTPIDDEAEAQRVDSLTLRNLFLASMQPLEADKNYLVLVEPDTIE